MHRQEYKEALSHIKPMMYIMCNSNLKSACCIVNYKYKTSNDYTIVRHFKKHLSNQQGSTAFQTYSLSFKKLSKRNTGRYLYFRYLIYTNQKCIKP